MVPTRAGRDADVTGGERRLMRRKNPPALRTRYGPTREWTRETDEALCEAVAELGRPQG